MNRQCTRNCYICLVCNSKLNYCDSVAWHTRGPHLILYGYIYIYKMAVLMHATCIRYSLEGKMPTYSPFRPKTNLISGKVVL